MGKVPLYFKEIMSPHHTDITEDGGELRSEISCGVVWYCMGI